eukprot:scaffold248438_cov104-Cyclotella_meneghiniana.AAC.4
MDWLSSFYRCDPRWQILKFFNEVAREGGVANEEENVALSPLAQLFDKARVFTVWRPTSDEAIKNMMLGIATGKGLDIKGKSAKKGNIRQASFSHKEKVRAYLRDGQTIRVFYQSEAARNEAHEMITDVKDYMLFAAMDAMHCSRPPDTDWDIGRGSEVNFMDMNLKTMRYDAKPGDARPVVFQFSKDFPMEPRTLLVAYEEYGRVKPVVSDFDCFLTGTRGVKYQQPIPKEQIDLVKWSVDNIGDVLDEQEPQSKKGWMETWFGVLKKAACKGFYPKTPKYGNGDPKSYEIISVAVSRLNETGCVRHGAECFNYFFPQDIDDTLLIISDTLPGKRKWMKGWILCDRGWKKVYDKLLASKHPNVQDSLNSWLPPDSGLREKIEDISRRHPNGFGSGEKGVSEGTELMDEMEDRLRRGLEKTEANTILDAIHQREKDDS